jgi:hypothetical protein
MSVHYDEKAHERALELHTRRWEEMHRLGETEGRDTTAYQQARQDVLDARRAVRFEASRPKKRVG